MPMPSTQIDTQFVNELLAATRDVFKTMVFQEVETASPIAGDALRPGANVVGTVAFAGKTSGIVAFYSTLEGAQAITAKMLGIEPANVNGELPDAIGELTNMIAGSFRTRMAGVRGETWAISVPTVTVGSAWVESNDWADSGDAAMPMLPARRRCAGHARSQAGQLRLLRADAGDHHGQRRHRPNGNRFGAQRGAGNVLHALNL